MSQTLSSPCISNVHLVTLLHYTLRLYVILRLIIQHPFKPTTHKSNNTLNKQFLFNLFQYNCVSLVNV